MRGPKLFTLASINHAYTKPNLQLRLIENLNYSLLKILMALYCLSRNFSKTHINNDIYFWGPFQNKGIKLEAKTTFIHI